MDKDTQAATGDRSDAAVRELDHTADEALLIRGRDYENLLYHAAAGLYSLVGPTGNKMPAGPPTEKQVTVDAPDADSLLVEWLSELAYWVETEFFIGSDIQFAEISGHHLKATIRGYRAVGVEKLIKAVTYHDLEISTTPDGLEAKVVFDV